MAGRVSRKKFLPEGPVQDLLAATTDEKFFVRDRALLGVLYAGGLRVGEVSRLWIEEVLAGDGGVIVVGKHWRVRFVPVAPVVLDWLAEYIGNRDTGPVFLAAHGGPMQPRLIRKVVDKYASKAQLPKISPHTLRHSCASHMAARGVYLVALMMILGHKHLDTTFRYLHQLPLPQDLLEEYRAAHPLAG